MALCLAVSGCSKESSNTLSTPEAPKAQQHPLDGVWDFTTSVDWSPTGTAYVRGTLYVKTENHQTVCALTTFQESETKNLLVDALSEKTTSAEQDCQIFVNDGEFSIKSSVRRGGDNYVPDDFALRLKGTNLLEGKLISNVNFDATFVKRGSGLQLASPWRMAERDRAERLIAPFTFLMRGKTGCVFGISAVNRVENSEGGLRFDLRRFCRSNDGNDRLTDSGDYFELQQGYYIACAKKMAYANWKTLFRENGTPIKTVYANVDGKFSTVVGQTVPQTGEGEPVKRILASDMAAKAFDGESVGPNTALGIVAQQHCM